MPLVSIPSLLEQKEGQRIRLLPFRSSFPPRGGGGGVGGSDELKQKILEGVQAPQRVPPGFVRVQLCSQEEQLSVLVY